MADPLMIIGTASVAGIIEALAKTVSKLHELHRRWKRADFTFINLIAQLTALKAALSKLEEWMDAGLDEGQDPHHQLVMDLEVSVACCRMLTHRMESEISELCRNADNTLDSLGKAKLMVKNGTLEELQKMVERQTSALTLLLTVCNCKAISDQKILLEKSSTRKIIRRVRDDTSSLYVQRDSTSRHSRFSQCTDSPSKITKSFVFDRELFISRVYERALKGSLRDTVEVLRQQKSRRESVPHLYSVSEEEKQRNNDIDRMIHKDSKRLQKECKVLILGDVDCCQLFLKQIMIRQKGGITARDLSEYKTVVRDNVWEILDTVGSIIEKIEPELDGTMKKHTQVISQGGRGSATQDSIISTTAAEALQELWKSLQFSDLLWSSGSDLPRSTEYFIQEIKRIAQPDYTPTPTDILKAQDRRPGIREYNYDGRRLSFSMSDASGLRDPGAKWIHLFENVLSIIYFVDLSCYNEPFGGASTGSKLLESISSFDKVINSRWFKRTSIILFLSNRETFQQKLGVHPLGNYVPGYTGGNDFQNAIKYIVGLFNSTNRTKLDIHHDLCNADDDGIMRLVDTVAQNTIILNNQKRLIL